MATINCNVPLKLRLTGQLDDAAWARLEEALVVRYARALGGALAVTRASAPSRSGTQARRQAPPARAGGRRGTPLPVALPLEGVVERIRSSFPATQGRPETGIFRGAYVVLKGTTAPRLWYLDADRPSGVQLGSIELYRELHGVRQPLGLEPGFYTVAFRPGGAGRLYRGGRPVGTPLANPEDMSITVGFVVGEPGADATRAATLRSRLFPVLQIRTERQQPPMTVGSKSSFHATVGLWRVDEAGRATALQPLGAIAILMRSRTSYRWMVDRRPPTGMEGPVQRMLTVEGDPDLRYTWEAPGPHEVICEVTVLDSAVSPEPVRERHREMVVTPETKLAIAMATLEKQQREATDETTRPWRASAKELLASLERQRQQYVDAKAPQALIDRAKETIDRATEQLFGEHRGRRMEGPFPIHAVLVERETAETRPLTLLLGRGADLDFSGLRYGPDPNEPPERIPGYTPNLQTWYLVDLTHPGAFRTHTGYGTSAKQAILRAFEELRTDIRSPYPPGRILARIRWPGIELHGLRPGELDDFTIETESWQRTAAEVASTAVTVAGVAGMAAALVFPPSAIVVNVLVVVGIAGGVLSVVNIWQRLEKGDFRWDSETFSDLVNIATAFTGLGGARAAARVRALGQTVQRGEELGASAVALLKQSLKAQRAWLYAGLGGDLSNGIILADRTYDELRLAAAAFDDEVAKREFLAGAGPDGERRWAEQLQMRVLSILARAALNGTLVVVSARGALAEAKQITTRISPGEPPPPPDPAGVRKPPRGPAAGVPAPPAAVGPLAPSPAREPVLVAAERAPALVRKAVIAETESGFEQAMAELTEAMTPTGMDDSQLERLRSAIWQMNTARREVRLRTLSPQVAQQRLAQFGAEGEAGVSGLRQALSDWLVELEQRRIVHEQEGRQPAAERLERRIAGLEQRSKELVSAEEAAKLAEAVTGSQELRDVAAAGGGPMLQRLWVMFRSRPRTIDFQEYVGKLLGHYVGNYGEFEAAFRLGPHFVILKAPDALVTVPGTDLVVMPLGGGYGGWLYVIDNKAFQAKVVDAVNALTRNYPKNLEADAAALAKLAATPGTPVEFQEAAARLQAAHQEIQSIVQGLTKQQLESIPVQAQINAVLARHKIARIVTNAGGEVTGLTPELEAMGLSIGDLN